MPNMTKTVKVRYSGKVKTEIVTTAIAAGIIVVGSLFFSPLVFTGRAAPGVYFGGKDIGGISQADLSSIVKQYEKSIQNQSVTLRLNEIEKDHTLGEIGVTVDVGATIIAIEQASARLATPVKKEVDPILVIDGKKARDVLHKDFLKEIDLPVNASLRELNSQFILRPSAPGQQIDTVSLHNDIQARTSQGGQNPIDLVAISAAAPVQDSEVGKAKEVADRLLQEGFTLTFEEKEFIVKAFTIRRLLSFVEQVDPENPANTILGARFDPEELRAYLNTTISPEIYQEAINAKFAVSEGEEAGAPRVEQFALPQRGQALNIEKTARAIAMATTNQQTKTALVVDITEPDVAVPDDIYKLGLTSLLARGESDFVGSPRNRVHNITVGASRYQGLLIPPGEEFGFNEHLGPVTGEAGFKPELVIKQNVTVPEFGGGLCQVSTTAFRAALYSGLKITERRNHSYAVSYYGTPGFDATIYPGYTDLRFLNNTPGYILIQTKVEGTKLIFEFWGTDDGREVEVIGPNTYDRQPSGAVKATLEQRVIREGEVVDEETFYSNYKSPKLFPHATTANGET